MCLWEDGLVACGLVASRDVLGFMWMIFRGRVGGGGSATSSFVFLLVPEDVRLTRGLEVEAVSAGDVGVAGL